jgi:mannose-6-phosphate isomerase-like protein (cupin superfamily)
MNILEQIRPEPSATDAFTKTVLNAGELRGSITLLAAGAENLAAESAVERVLFIAQGSVVATVSDVKYVLAADEAFVVAPGRSYSVRNNGDSPAKIFTLALPSRPRSEPQLVVLS